MLKTRLADLQRRAAALHPAGACLVCNWPKSRRDFIALLDWPDDAHPLPTCTGCGRTLSPDGVPLEGAKLYVAVDLARV